MKSIFGILTIIVIITTMPFAFADIAFDQEVKQNIKIEIGKDANVHVIHEISDFGQNSAKLEFLDGTRSNFEIVCTLSCPYEFDNPEQIFEESNYMVFSQYPAFQDDLIVEYDLENVIELNNGLWKWEFSSKHNPNFYFDESIDLIFFDGTAINLSLNKGFACSGSCNMNLEFFDEDETLSVTSFDGGVSIQSDDKISNFVINDNTISFDTNKEKQLLLIDIPREMIGDVSFNVYITEPGIIPDDEDRLKKQLVQNVETITIVLRSNIAGSVLVTNLDTNNISTSEGGGCLIATAAYGSEIAPQVQFLREIRDNTVLQTQSGVSFMSAFNQFYYSFSPAVADYERENPVFKEAVKVGLTPLLTSLTILNYVDIDTEQEMLGYGIGIIMLNIGMYFVAPAIVIVAIKKRRK
jgi:hypothetical protein